MDEGGKTRKGFFLVVQNTAARLFEKEDWLGTSTSLFTTTYPLSLECMFVCTNEWVSEWCVSVRHSHSHVFQLCLVCFTVTQKPSTFTYPRTHNTHFHPILSSTPYSKHRLIKPPWDRQKWSYKGTVLLSVCNKSWKAWIIHCFNAHVVNYLESGFLNQWLAPLNGIPYSIKLRGISKWSYKQWVLLTDVFPA